MIESIQHIEKQLAIIIRRKFQYDGIKFFTPNSYSQQLAFMKHSAGHEILPHVHNKVCRKVLFTQEVLVIRKGKLRVDFYSEERGYLESRILKEGDVIMLASGGHGFEVLEDLEMYEIKQGPYSGEADKTRFAAIPKEEIFFADAENVSE